MSDTQKAELGKKLTSSIVNVADEAISQSVALAESKCNELINSVKEKIGQIKTGYLEVSVNNMPAKKLTQRAGKHLPRMIVNAKLGLNTMLVGPAGCGKTTMAYQVAEALDVKFGSVCLTAGASETWLFGRQTPTGFVEGPFSKLYRDGGVFLADEIDAADANLLLSINTALSHGEMLNPMNGEVIKRHKDFIFIAAANTNGKGSNHVYTGRSRLDAATLDRFVLITVDYDEEIERELCSYDSFKQFLNQTRSVLKKQQFDEFVSTRAFLYVERQFNAGITAKEIKDSLISNWSDAAKTEAEKIFGKIDFPAPPTKGKLETKALPEEKTEDVEVKRGRGRPVGWRKNPEFKIKIDGDFNVENHLKSVEDAEKSRIQNEILKLQAENEKMRGKPSDGPLKADNQEMYERFNKGIPY